MTATGVGSLPGDDIHDAIRMVLEETPDLPAIPELPDRGPIASMTGRTLAMITELGFDLQPAGWRLTDASGIDHRRAKSLLAQDLDALEELTSGYAGPLKLQVAGPWTLAATVERPRGDKILADVGARRELAQALALGIAEHIADVRRRVSGALVVQVDEPALPFVLAGQVPTASGFNRHRSVNPPLASEALEWAFAAIADAEVEPIAHCCAADAPLALLRGAGASGLCLDATTLSAAAYDEIGALLDSGQRLFLGIAPATDPESAPTERALVDRVLRLLEMLGFDPGEVAGQLVLTPGCGLAGATPAYARQVLALLRRTATACTG